MIRFLTAGESHGPMLTAILEGVPAGMPLAQDDIDMELQRRQKGYGAGGRMSIEQELHQRCIRHPRRISAVRWGKRRTARAPQQKADRRSHRPAGHALSAALAHALVT